MKWLAPLVEWPGNIRLRTFLAVLLVAVLYNDPDAVGFMFWAVGAVAIVNLVAWWFGPRRGISDPGP